jgi:hypothetical protein
MKSDHRSGADRFDLVVIGSDEVVETMTAAVGENLARQRVQVRRLRRAPAPGGPNRKPRARVVIVNVVAVRDAEKLARLRQLMNHG